MDYNGLGGAGAIERWARLGRGGLYRCLVFEAGTWYLVTGRVGWRGVEWSGPGGREGRVGLGWFGLV